MRTNKKKVIDLTGKPLDLTTDTIVQIKLKTLEIALNFCQHTNEPFDTLDVIVLANGLTNWVSRTPTENIVIKGQE